MNLTKGKMGFFAGFIGTIFAYASSYILHWPKRENILAPIIIGVFLSVIVAFWPQSKVEPE